MTPAMIALVLLTGLLALLPTRRLAERTGDRWLVAGYYLVLWMLLAASVLAPGLLRITVPLVVILAVAPFVTFRAGIARILGRRPPEQRPPPRNVTPPDAP